MQFSYSRVDLFKRCPYHFKLRYIDRLTELPNYEANSPLIVGHALHTGIEKGKKAMLKEFYNAFPLVTNDVILITALASLVVMYLYMSMK